MGFFFGTGPEWPDDSLNQIQVASVLSNQEKRFMESLGFTQGIPPIPYDPDELGSQD